MSRERPIPHDASLVHEAWPIVATRQSQGDAPHFSRSRVTHSYSTLVFYVGGESRVELKGEWTLRVGDVLLVPAGEPHRMIEAQGAELWGLAFCASCFAAEGAASLLFEPFERVRNGGSAVVHIPSERHAYLENLFVELEKTRARRGQATSHDAVQRSLLTLILNEVEQASSASAPALPVRSSVAVDALRFIERNCLGRLTLHDVAAAVGRSPAYVTTALTQATGRSAVQWIVSGRMAEARRLLLHSDEMVDVIAERVGYADATHFIRMFRREHGATPAVWRSAQMREVRAR